MKISKFLEDALAIAVIGAWLIVAAMGFALTLAMPFIAWHFIGKYW